jgi:hypothetical protein
MTEYNYIYINIIFDIICHIFGRPLNIAGFEPQFSDICQESQNDSNVSNQNNHAAASPWLRRSWSPNYSVLALAVHAVVSSRIYLSYSFCIIITFSTLYCGPKMTITNLDTSLDSLSND